MLLAGLVHIILDENLHDVEFCAENIENLDTFKASLSRFTPTYVAERTDLDMDDIIAAARLFAAGPHPAIDCNDPGAAGFSGSLVIAEFDSLEDAQAWADADPYIEAGVYARVVVKPYKIVLP